MAIINNNDDNDNDDNDDQDNNSNTGAPGWLKTWKKVAAQVGKARYFWFWSCEFEPPWRV